MQRMKNTPASPPRPASSLFAGMMIGSAIMTMAAQAMMLGAGVAIRDSTRKGG
ncbi:MAG TPA: hypothetical protein VHO91_13210 [Rhodopila sp.]|nr:hypothetical protein [Rhodopila sp.]